MSRVENAAKLILWKIFMLIMIGRPVFSEAFARPVNHRCTGLKILVCSSNFCQTFKESMLFGQYLTGKNYFGCYCNFYQPVFFFKKLPRGSLPCPKISSVTGILKFQKYLIFYNCLVILSVTFSSSFILHKLA
jgi:hypothetical protein